MSSRTLRSGSGSIAWKLTLGNVLVSGVALLLAGVALGAYDRATFRENLTRNLSIQAEVVGANSVSALVFNDASSARATLAALSASPHIMSARVWTPDNREFAAYQRISNTRAHTAPPIPAGESEMYRFESDQILLARRVTFNGKTVGTVSIRSDLEELDARRARYVGIIALVLVASMVAALVLSWFSQRAISTPIVHLAQIARRVSVDRDYAVRAAVSGGADEVVVLTTAFNDMLTQIQERDRSLQAAQDALEARVAERTSELDAVNKELEAFSYSVSHDLRAPLRHVTGFANLLEAHVGDRLDDQGQKYLDTISQSAKRMGQLIDDLLAFSRMGRTHIVKQRVSLNELVRDARAELFADGDCQIDWHVAQLPDVDGDAAMLRLAITNLLSNAAKYCGRQPGARVEVGTTPGDGGETVVFVRDNGVGFDMQYVHKLFGVFQRLHRSDEFEGTGIGLANVRRIIHRHGGRVWAEGAINRGATFYFSLPGKGLTS